MNLIEKLFENLPNGPVIDVRIGIHWTAVVVEVDGRRRCGLASTLFGGHDHHREPDAPQAGRFEEVSGGELAQLALYPESVQTSVGLAAINALLPRYPERWREENAEEVITRCGFGKRVALIGSFPFVPTLREKVGDLTVLELNPGAGDLPADAAPEVLPGVDVVAITGMTILNHTLEGLLSLCDPKATVLVLGPSTPLSPALFECGVDIISGSVVTAIDAVLRIVSQGGNFRQVHRGGVRLVNMYQ